MSIAPTPRTTLKRLPKRGSHERETIDAILDEGLVAHVAFVSPDGTPVVLPTAYGREGDTLYMHGAVASRMARAMASGLPLCVTVTLLDGLVLARSAFHHSMNYRCAVVYGTAVAVTDEADKRHAMRVITEHLVPGRWEGSREPSAPELAGTLVLAMPITEASAKVRTGPPVDDEADYALDYWAGVLPLGLAAGAFEPDARLKPGIAAPEALKASPRYGG